MKRKARSATPSSMPNSVPAASDPGREFYLQRLGDRVRQERAKRGMTRKILAHDSGLSERYLAQLEAGKGNISINLLRQVADALNVPLTTLFGEDPDLSVDLRLMLELLRRLNPDELVEARTMLGERFGVPNLAPRHGRIALIGLRGAGKSTLGRRLADDLGVPFIELDQEIERESGISLSEIFALYGQSAFRRFERKALDRVLELHPRVVLATGGSIVADATTFEHLLSSCFAIWLRAAPEEHMTRVMAQGDFRPMADNRQSMADLKRILTVRGPLYAKADAIVDTAGRTAEASFASLLEALPDDIRGHIGTRAASR